MNPKDKPLWGPRLRKRKIRTLHRLIQLAEENKAVWITPPPPFPAGFWVGQPKPARFVANRSLLRLNSMIRNGELYEYACVQPPSRHRE